MWPWLSRWATLCVYIAWYLWPHRSTTKSFSRCFFFIGHRIIEDDEQTGFRLFLLIKMIIIKSIMCWLAGITWAGLGSQHFQNGLLYFNKPTTNRHRFIVQRCAQTCVPLPSSYYDFMPDFNFYKQNITVRETFVLDSANGVSYMVVLRSDGIYLGLVPWCGSGRHRMMNHRTVCYFHIIMGIGPRNYCPMQMRP